MTPDLPALAARAQRLMAAGQADEAAAAYEALLTHAPGYADGWFNLGWLRRSLRRFEAALDAYGRALAAGIARPEEVHANRAAILSEHLGREAEAEAELRRAIALAPGFLVGWLNLGMLHEDRGDPDAARAAYTGALGVRPGDGRALARLAAIDLFQGRSDPAAIRAALAAMPADGPDAAELGFALGDALDASGDYDAAFVAYAGANRAARASAGAPAYDRSAQERLVDALIATFPLAEAVAPAVGAATPIFVCGMFRSGSTLVEQMLSRVAGVTAGGELELIPAIVHALQPYPGAATAGAARLAPFARAYRDHLAAQFPGAERVTDKRPDNVLHLGLIRAMLPDARIVHTVRHPLDNILSVWFLHFADSVTYGHDLGDIAHYYVQYRRLLDHWGAAWPGMIHDVRYDRLVADPRAEMGGVLDHLGLGWDEACLAPEAGARSVRTASLWQVRRPLHARSSGRWRNYEAHLGPVRAILDAAGLD